LRSATQCASATDQPLAITASIEETGLLANSAFHREAFADKGPLTIVIEGDPHLLNRYDVIEQSEKHLGASRRWAVFNFRYDD
jgi:ABC-type tungstate transport system permease subunit